MAIWYPVATPWLCPTWKIRARTNPVKGAVLHSAVGYLAGLHHELRRSDRGAAWHFSVMQDGAVEQHAPLDAVLWHAGDWSGDQDGADGNGELIGIELEGGYDPLDEPLTDEQKAASLALVRWIAEQGGWTPSRAVPRTLWEHNELSDTGTLCPFGRIPWSVYVEEEPMSNAYLVERGDTLGAIARRFGTTVAVLADRNGIADPNRIEVGQVIRLTDTAPQPLGVRRVAFAEAASLSTRLNAEIRKLIEGAAP